MDTKIIYSGITRRIVAYTVDSILLFVMIVALVAVVLFVTDVQVSDVSFIMKIILTLTVYSFYLIFNTLMLVKFGCTPGLFLFGMRVKDRNTLEKVTVMQAIIRTVCFYALYLIYDILRELHGSFLISLPILILVLAVLILLPILILILAVRDERKQALHDKIAKTVVVKYQPR